MPQPPTDRGFLNIDPMMKPSGSTANRPSRMTAERLHHAADAVGGQAADEERRRDQQDGHAEGDLQAVAGQLAAHIPGHPAGHRLEPQQRAVLPLGGQHGGQAVGPAEHHLQRQQAGQHERAPRDRSVPGTVEFRFSQSTTRMISEKIT